MAVGDIGALIQDFSIGAPLYGGGAVLLDGDNYALSDYQAANALNAYTFPITALGGSGPVINAVQIQGAVAPGFGGVNIPPLKVGPGVCAFPYMASFALGGFNLIIQTRAVSDAGVVGAVIQTWDWGAVGAPRDFIHIAGEVYALVVQANLAAPFALTILTVRITAAGAVGPVIDNIGWACWNDTAGQIRPLGTNNIYVVLCQGEWQVANNDDTWVKTITIDSAGNIGAAEIDTLQLDATGALMNTPIPRLANIHSDIWMAVYEGHQVLANMPGVAHTFRVSAAGVLTNISSFTFEPLNSTQWFGDIHPVGRQRVTFVYTHLASLGLQQSLWGRTISLDLAGNITGTYTLRELRIPVGIDVPVYYSYRRAVGIYFAVTHAEIGQVGRIMSFPIEEAVLPTVQTGVVLVNAPVATLTGQLLTDGGESCSCGFLWGSLPTALTNDTGTTEHTAGESLTASLTGLTPATTYYYQAYARNLAGTVYGAVRSFIYLGNANVITLPATGVY